VDVSGYDDGPGVLVRNDLEGRKYHVVIEGSVRRKLISGCMEVERDDWAAWEESRGS